MSTPEQIILITGARDWKDKEVISEALAPYKDKRVLLIHGDCVGADRLAGAVAEELKFELSVHPIKKEDWKRYGLGAGPVRNREMVNKTTARKNTGITTIVLAFHDNLDLSKGTKDCVKQATKAGLNVLVHSYDGEDGTCSE
jgi:hypothetical protein